MYKPCEVKTSDRRAFMGSQFRNSETETIARNIILQQQSIDGEKWTPFTWEDYKNFCSHNVTDTELGVIKALASGGKPVWNTTTVLNAGYLEEDPKGTFKVTGSFLHALPAELFEQ